MAYQNRSGVPANTNRVISISPVVLPAPDRIVDLQMRIAAPATGSDLPIILLSHGHGMSNHLSSLNGNLPLLDHWASRGFVVIQPTHLDSKTLRLGSDAPGYPLFWRSRAADMKYIIDHLNEIEASVPEISGRLDHSRIAAAGLSLGGNTVSVLLGATITDPITKEVVDLSEPRIKAGILLSAPGNGGANMSEFAQKNYTFLANIDFSTMATPALVVAGDKDVSAHLSVRGADWHEDSYHLSPAPKALLTVFGGEHLLGGVSGYDAAETSDENPERVAFVQQLTTAYLRTALYPEDQNWPDEMNALAGQASPFGEIRSK